LPTVGNLDGRGWGNPAEGPSPVRVRGVPPASNGADIGHDRGAAGPGI